MEIRKGMQVVTPDDQKIGIVKNVVITPQGGTITHLVIERGFMFTEERVMPIEWIASVNAGNHLVLDDNHHDFEQLPDFKETYYVTVDDQHVSADMEAFYYYGAPGNPPLLYGQGVMPAAAYTPRYTTTTVENIPESTVALRIGAKVISWDEKHVGNVESVFTDAEANVTHFIISQGLLLKTRRLAPTAWIERVDEDAVYLGVTAALLERLPEYEATR
jgi:uncharacterized protein YrrD